jgi:hypothetical protein
MRVAFVGHDLKIIISINMKDLNIVKVDDLHQCLASWIKDNRVIIGDYEDMKDMVLKMIRAGHCFSMDRDRLRDAMEDISYMMNAEDEALKDRVLRSLEYEDEDSDEEGGGGLEEFMRSQMAPQGHQGHQGPHGPDCAHGAKDPEEVSAPDGPTATADPSTETADATTDATAAGATDATAGAE